MAIINFAIPEALEFRVKETVKQKGFSSKAELFRFAVLRYLDELTHTKKLPFDDDPEINVLTQRLENALQDVDLSKLPPMKKQLERLNYI